MGFGGIAGHTFIGLHEAENSYFHWAMCAQDYSAVTAACMMKKAEVFRTVGGFTEELAVAFNDIDYCMKVRAAGKLVVMRPTRPCTTTNPSPEGLRTLRKRWNGSTGRSPFLPADGRIILEDGDPYYNPNLTLRKSNFALRDLLKEKIGEPYKLEV